MKKIHFIFILCLLLSVPGVAQTLKGHIYDAKTNEPLIGASISYKAGTQGTVSDINGAYEIQLPEGGVDLVISYIGYEDMQMPIVISKRETMVKDIYMKEKTNLM